MRVCGLVSTVLRCLVVALSQYKPIWLRLRRPCCLARWRQSSGAIRGMSGWRDSVHPDRSWSPCRKHLDWRPKTDRVAFGPWSKSFLNRCQKPENPVNTAHTYLRRSQHAAVVHIGTTLRIMNLWSQEIQKRPLGNRIEQSTRRDTLSRLSGAASITSGTTWCWANASIFDRI